MDNANASEIVIELSKAGINLVGELLKTIMINSREGEQFKRQIELQELKAKLNTGIITKKDLLGITGGANDMDTLQKVGEKLYSVDVNVSDLQNILNKCEKNNVPVSVVADTDNVDKVQVVCLEENKEQLEKFSFELIEQKDKELYNMFEIDENAIDSMSLLADENRLEVNFFRNDDGKAYCQYLKTEENMVSNAYKQVLDAKKQVETIDTYVHYDENLEDKFQFLVQDTNMKVTKRCNFCDKSELLDVLQENFGYNAIVSNEVANRVYRDLESRVEKLNKVNISKIEVLTQELVPISEELGFDIPEYKDMDNTLSQLKNQVANVDCAMNLDNVSENEKLNLANTKDKLLLAITNISNQKSIVDNGISTNKQKLNTFLTDSRQKQLLKRLETNIQVVGETPAIKDYQFSRAVYKKDNAEHILIQDKRTKKAVSYRVPIDWAMLEQDFKAKLGISDKLVLSSLLNKCEQLGYTAKAKTIKVDRKYTIQADLSNAVTVSLGDRSVKCDLSDIPTAKKTLQREFGMSEKKADRIIEKARKQNPHFDSVRKSSPLTNKKHSRGSI